MNKFETRVLEKLEEIKALLTKEQVTSTEKLELEDHNFKVDSNGWKKQTREGQDYLVNDKEDIWELINCEDSKYNGEQLFTFKAMMRETKKAGKIVPTDEEFNELLKTKKDMPNVVFSGLRYSDGSFAFLSKYAYFWSSTVSGSNAWNRYLFYTDATVYRDEYAQANGFSVRCLKG